MYLRICTREVDNGWILEVESNIALSGNPLQGRDEKKEVYRGYGQAKRRVMGILQEMVEELGEGIPEREK